MPTFKRVLSTIAILVALYLVNAIMSKEGLFGFGLGAYPSDVIMTLTINIILAVSLNLITGFTGQFSIGHAGFMAIGAYSSAYLVVYHAQFWERALAGTVGFTLAHALIFIIAIAFGSLIAGFAGLLVGIPSLRLRGDYLAIVTLGFGEIIRVWILNIDAVGGARGYSGIPKLANFFWIYLFAVISVTVVSRTVRSSFGRSLIAIREDEIAAEAMGVDTTRSKVISFVLSSAMAGIGGGLFGHYLMYVHTNSFTFIKSIEIIIMIVIGGLGSITGSVVGAVLYIALTEGLRGFAQYRMILFSLLLIVIMIVRPQGLLGHREFASFFRRARRVGGPTPGVRT